MSLIDSFSTQIETSKIKLVKNACLIYEKDVLACKHYETIIFAYNGKTCEVKRNLSTTSNRQIRYLIQALDIQESDIVDLNKNEALHSKWSFSGEFVQ